MDALVEMNIESTFPECALFVARYDTSGDRRLSFAEFSTAFLPLDPKYSKKLQSRKSNFYPRVRSQENIFNAKTGELFANMWYTHIRVEYASEALR